MEKKKKKGDGIAMPNLERPIICSELDTRNVLQPNRKPPGK